MVFVDDGVEVLGEQRGEVLGLKRGQGRVRRYDQSV